MHISRGKLSALVAVIVVAVIVVAFAGYELLPSSRASGAHFGFPSQSQVSSGLNTSVARSQVYSKTNYEYGGIFFKKIEAVFYNASSNSSALLDCELTEVQLNSTQIAASLASQQFGNYTKIAGLGVSNFTYKSVEVTVLRVTAIDIVSYVTLIHTGSYCCYMVVTAMAYHGPVNTTALSESMVSAVT